MSGDPVVARVPVGPERPWVMGVGGLVLLGTVFLFGWVAWEERSVFMALLALFQLVLAEFGMALLGMHLRGPHHVTQTADGRLVYPAWFGRRTRSFDLADVAWVEVTPERVVVAFHDGRRRVGWSRPLFGKEGLRDVGRLVHAGAASTREP